VAAARTCAWTLGDDAAPTPARARGADEMDQGREAEEDLREQIVGEAVRCRWTGVAGGVRTGVLAAVFHTMQVSPWSVET
jgi:hypothetical protein